MTLRDLQHNNRFGLLMFKNHGI